MLSEDALRKRLVHLFGLTDKMLEIGAVACQTRYEWVLELIWLVLLAGCYTKGI